MINAVTLKSMSNVNSIKMHNNKRQNFYVYVTPKKEKMFTAFLAQSTKKKIERNRNILLSIVDVIVTLGKRNIGLRGSWDKVKKKEDGNFQFFVDWKAVFDQDLKHHIEKGARNAQYISPTTQNELIACCEAEIRDSIIEKCKEAPFFSLCADETTDVSVTEQLSLCVRYIDQLRGLGFDGASVMSGVIPGCKQDFEKFSHVQHMFIVDHIN